MKKPGGKPNKQEALTIQSVTKSLEPINERKLNVELSVEELRRIIVCVWESSRVLCDETKPFAYRVRGSEYKELARRLDTIFTLHRLESRSSTTWVAAK